MAEAPFLTLEEIQQKFTLAQEAFQENKRRSLDQRKEVVGAIVQHLREQKEAIATQLTE